MRPGPWFPLVLAFLSIGLLSRTAHAQAYVPTNYPTISAALASGAPDIRVLPGTYVENLVINRRVLVRGQGGPVVVQGNVTATSFTPHDAASLQALHITGNVIVQTSYSDSFTLDGCRVEGRISQGGSTNETGQFRLTDCVVDGGVDLSPQLAFYLSNTILGGLKTGFENDLFIIGNHIQGPAEVGIDVFWIFLAPFLPTRIFNNTITGTTIGIRQNGANCDIENNLVKYCSDDGINVGQAGAGHAGGTIQLNGIQDCGGDGIDLNGLFVCRANTIVRSGLVGIR